MHRFFAACAALVMFAGAANAAPATADHYQNGTLNVFGSPLSLKDQDAIKKRIPIVANKLHTTITVVVVVNPSGNIRDLSTEVSDQTIALQPHGIVIIILARHNPAGSIIAGRKVSRVNTTTAEVSYLFPALLSRNYSNCVNEALTGLERQAPNI